GLIRADAPSQFHSSHFEVTVANGEAVTSVAGFDRVEADLHIHEALVECRWNEEQIAGLGERVAAIGAAYPEELEKCWTIEHVACLPAWRGQGLVTALLERVLKRGAELGYRRAVVDVFDGNDRARRVYERAGFRVTGAFGGEVLRRVLNRDQLIRLERSLGS